MPAPAYLIDEDLTTSAAVSLRISGYDAMAVKETSLRHIHDFQVLWSAVTQGRTVVTHNGDDFLLLHGAWRLWGVWPPHFGILVIPQRYRLSGPEIAGHVIQLADSERPLRNELYLLDRSGTWGQPATIRQ